MSDLIRTERRDDVLEIVLNRPEKRNAINFEMYEALDQAVRQTSLSSGLRVVLVRGEGKMFSSGIDVSNFMMLAQKYGQQWSQRGRIITRDFQAVLNRLSWLEIPVVALIHGHCLGLALELALACDIRIASQNVRLALPEARLGLIPDVGGTTRLVRLVGPARAKELVFTGREIDAEQAQRWGLVNRIVPNEALLDAGERVVDEIRRAAPLAVAMAKRVVDGAANLERGLDLEGWAQSQLFQTEDFLEAVRSFMEGREPNFEGH